VLMHFLHNGLSLVGPGLLKLGGDETKSGAAAFPIIPQSYFGIAVVSFVLGLMLVSRAGKHAVAVIEPTSETTFSNRSST